MKTQYNGAIIGSSSEHETAIDWLLHKEIKKGGIMTVPSDSAGTPGTGWAAAGILRDPEDTCIVEGFPAYDPALEGIAVHALNVTTKQLQQARRA